MPLPPRRRLVAALGRAVEPLVHAPDRVDAAAVGRIRVVDDAVQLLEGAEAGPLADVGRGVRAERSRELRDGAVAAAQLPGLLAPVVVVDGAVALLLLGEPDVE